MPQFQNDWWIYGLVSGVAGALNLFAGVSSPPLKSAYWFRLLASLVIVLGTAEALFLCWSVGSLGSASMLSGAAAEVSKMASKTDF